MHMIETYRSKLGGFLRNTLFEIVGKLDDSSRATRKTSLSNGCDLKARDLKEAKVRTLVMPMIQRVNISNF